MAIFPRSPSRSLRADRCGLDRKRFSFMFRITVIIGVLLLLAAGSSGQTLKKIEDDLLAHLGKLEKVSNYGGDANYDVLGKENKALRAALIRYGSRADVLKYRFPRLKEKLFLTTSKDGNLRAYSWDSEEGGTMHDFYTVYQFRGRSGNVHTWAAPYSQDLEERGAGGFVTEVFQAETKSTPIYLAVSTFIASTSLAGQTISALRIDGERLDVNPKVIRTTKEITNEISFAHDFFSVVDHPERPIKLIFYDDTKKEFRFPVVIEDQGTPQGRVTNRFITYRFNGQYFVKVG
jgi:hypothetical protein